MIAACVTISSTRPAPAGSFSAKTVMRICERRRAAMIQPTKPVQTSRYCASSSVQASGALSCRDSTPSSTATSSDRRSATAGHAHDAVGEVEEGFHRIQPAGEPLSDPSWNRLFGC